MPNHYKILGINSFSENLKSNIQIGDQVVLKSEKYNIKSKNAIGVYTKENKKLGYLPIESKDEISLFRNSYKIVTLILNKDYPLVEIARQFERSNFLLNVEYPYEKKIKYTYKLIHIPDELQKKLTGLKNYLLTKKINVKKLVIIYYDHDFINLLIETSAGIEQFQCVTLDYFKKNSDKYEELNDNNLIENMFFRELLFYRLECYFEKNYKRPIELPEINNNNYIQYIIDEKIHNDILYDVKKNINKNTIYELIKLYLRYLFHKNDYYVLKYGNELLGNYNYTDVNLILSKIIPNYSELNKFIENYNMELGNFTYNHDFELYDYIDFTNDDSVFVLSLDFNINFLYNALLTKKKNLIIYNPLIGNILKIENINLDIIKKI